jgi:hypothetical protein
LTPNQILRAVYVTNISENATLKNVSDFFGYCGTVEKIVQARDVQSEGKQFAVIVFENIEAYNVAKLLGSTNLVDSEVHIFPYSEIVPVDNPNEDLPSERVPTSELITNFVASAYITGESLLDSVKSRVDQIDEVIPIKKPAKEALKFGSEKAQQVDDALGITEKLVVAKDVISEKLQGAKESAVAVSYQANQYEIVKLTSEYLYSGWNYLKSSLIELKQNTNTKIAQQKGELAPEIEEQSREQYPGSFE